MTSVMSQSGLILTVTPDAVTFGRNFSLRLVTLTLQILEKRLRGRGTEKEEAIQKRLGNAKGEIEAALEPGKL